MDIYVYSDYTANDCVGVIDDYTSFNYTKKFQSSGSWTLKGSYTPELRELLQVDYIISAENTGLNGKSYIQGIIQTIDFETDEEGNTTYTAYGIDLNGVLGYRIVWNTYYRNAPMIDWIAELVNRNTQNERYLFEDIEVRDGAYFSCPTLDKQVSYTNLLAAVEDACTSQKTNAGLLLGFNVYFNATATGLRFELVQGDDRSLDSDNPFVVSKELNNVNSFHFAESKKDVANVVLCGGEGEGSERKFTTAGNLEIAAFARKEVFKDAKDIQSEYTDSDGNQQTLSESEYMSLLQQAADSALVDGTLSVDAESTITLDKAFELLGAKVSLIDKSLGIRTDDFVTEVNVIDEADGKLTTITIGKGVDAKTLLI